MHRKPISAILAVTVLALASLACNAITGGGVPNAQATANAALTQAFSNNGDAAATLESAQATADAALGSFGDATATTAPGDNPDATPEGAATDIFGLGGEGPEDVPLVDAQNTVLFASAEVVSYQTAADYKTTVQFYKDEMPNNGWSIDANASVETDTATILYCTKDNRQASVSVTLDPTTNGTVVLITITQN